MKRLLVLSLMVAIALVYYQTGWAQSIETVFTYQGKLVDGGSPANDQYDFEFKLFNALVGGDQYGVTLIKEDISVYEGYFTVDLDFVDDPNVFNGETRWLQIGVRPGGDSGSFTPLNPRQELTPTPYAQHAKSVSAPLLLVEEAPPGTAVLGVGSTGEGVAIGASSKNGDIGMLGKNGSAVVGISPTGYAGFFDGKGQFNGHVGIGTEDVEYGANLQVANRVNIMDHSTINPNLFIGDNAFRRQVFRLWFRTLRRRSQRYRLTWKRMDRLVKRWIPYPRVYHPYPEQRLAVIIQGRSPVR